MAAVTDFLVPFIGIEGSYNEDNTKVSDVKDEILEYADDTEQMSDGKPPRHLSVVWHSISTVALVYPTEYDSDLGAIGAKSPAEVFDGHGGIDAASFTGNNILKFIVEGGLLFPCLFGKCNQERIS